MNWVRNLVQGVRSHDGTGDSSPKTKVSPQLRRLLDDICRALPTEVELKEQLVRRIVPVFCRDFADCPTNDISRLAEAPTLALEIGRQFVADLKRQVGRCNSSKEAALSIVKYFACDEANENWVLLYAVSLLASTGHQPILRSLAETTVPSALARCVCVLVHLPEEVSEQSASTEVPIKDKCRVSSIPASSPNLRRDSNNAVLPTETMFSLVSSTIVKLCQIPESVQSLVDSEDLALLLDTATKKLPLHCKPWQQIASASLGYIGQNLTPLAVEFITLSRGLVPHCLRNIQSYLNSEEKPDPAQLVSVVSALFSLLQHPDRILRDEFENCQGYTALEEALQALDPPDEDHIDSWLIETRKLLTFVSMLTRCGPSEVLPSSMDNAPYQSPDFATPQPTGIGR